RCSLPARRNDWFTGSYCHMQRGRMPDGVGISPLFLRRVAPLVQNSHDAKFILGRKIVDDVAAYRMTFQAGAQLVSCSTETWFAGEKDDGLSKCVVIRISLVLAPVPS